MSDYDAQADYDQTAWDPAKTVRAELKAADVLRITEKLREFQDAELGPYVVWKPPWYRFRARWNWYRLKKLNSEGAYLE